MITFKDFNLHSTIYQAVDACGYTTPTPVQTKSIPEIMQGRDVAVSAQTGTGKTAAFILPILHRLSSRDQTNYPSVLILTPTRELANQINKAIETYGKFLRLRTVSLVGGMPYPLQIKKLKQGTDLIVATPGRLIDHIEQQRIDLSKIDVLVLDEADRMLDMGFIDDVRYIAKLTPSSRQTLLFSATLDNHLINAVKTLLNKPLRIDLSNERITAPQIKQEMYKAQNAQHKSRLLKHFLSDETIYKAIIFSATKRNAERLANQLCDEGFAAGALHGDLRQNARNRTLEQLRRGKIQFLVATDVAARGIDVSDITHVINFDLPHCDDYVHRIGRTGRAGKTGVAISFVLPTETGHLRSIERYIGQRIQLSELDQPLPLDARPAWKDAEKPEPGQHQAGPFTQERKKNESASGSEYKAKFKKNLPNDKYERKSRDKADFSPNRNQRRDKFKAEGFSSDVNKHRNKFKHEGFSSDRSKRKPLAKEDFSPNRNQRRNKFKDEDFSPDKSKRRNNFKDEAFSPNRNPRRNKFKDEDFSPDRSKHKPLAKEDFSPDRSKRRNKFKDDFQQRPAARKRKATVKDSFYPQKSHFSAKKSQKTT